MKKFPKKAKLITDGGFYQFIKVDGFVETINVPLIKRIKYCSPETSEISVGLNIQVEFTFERTTKTMAIYKQSDVISEVK